MARRWYAFVSAMFWLGLGVAPQAHARKDNSEIEDITMAEQGLLASLAVQSSPKGRSLCFQNAVACVGPDRAEMALALIAARNSRRSLLALARLVRFKLDGANGEDYDGYVVAKGAAIEKVLASLSPEKLHEQCSQEFGKLADSYRSALEGAHETAVCDDTNSINEHVQELLSALHNGAGSER